jgi:hypothetical protein
MLMADQASHLHEIFMGQPASRATVTLKDLGSEGEAAAKKTYVSITSFFPIVKQCVLTKHNSSHLWCCSPTTPGTTPPCFAAYTFSSAHS